MAVESPGPVFGARKISIPKSSDLHKIRLSCRYLEGDRRDHVRRQRGPTVMHETGRKTLEFTASLSALFGKLYPSAVSARPIPSFASWHIMQEFALGIPNVERLTGNFGYVQRLAEMNGY